MARNGRTEHRSRTSPSRQLAKGSHADFWSRSEQSVVASWVAVLAEALDSYNVDSALLFKRAGVDILALRSPGARIPTRQLDLLWTLSVEATGDEALALEVGRRVHPATLHALGFALFASSTLEEAFHRLARYVRLLSHLPRVDVSIVRDEIRLVITPLDDSMVAIRILGFCSALVKIWREMYRVDFSPKRVRLGRFAQPRSKEASDRIQRYFGCPVAYSAEEILLAFSLQDARKILPAANAELARRNDEMVQEHLAELDRSAWTPLVAAEIIRQLPSGAIDKAVVAARLGIGARSLQRRLAAEGVTYRDIVEDTRRSLAERYVRERRRSLKEIAFLLGYSDLSNFTRAFRSWFGEAPSVFQERQRRSK